MSTPEHLRGQMMNMPSSELVDRFERWTRELVEAEHKVTMTLTPGAKRRRQRQEEEIAVLDELVANARFVLLARLRGLERIRAEARKRELRELRGEES